MSEALFAHAARLAGGGLKAKRMPAATPRLMAVMKNGRPAQSPPMLMPVCRALKRTGPATIRPAYSIMPMSALRMARWWASTRALRRLRRSGPSPQPSE